MIGVNAFREERAHLDQHLLYPVGQGKRVDPRLFLDPQDDRRLAHEPGIALFDAGLKSNVRHLLQQNGPSVLVGHHQMACPFDQLLRLLGTPDIHDQKPAAVLVDRVATGVGIVRGQRPLDLVDGDIEEIKPAGIGSDAQLPYVAAHRQHLRDAGDRHQPGPDVPVGKVAQRHHVAGVRRQGDNQDFAHDRRYRSHFRRQVVGQLFARLAQPFRDQLAIAIDVGPELEVDHDDRKARAGDRAYPLHAFEPGHRRLDREGDPAFDLFGREPLALGDDGNGRPVDFRQDVDGDPLQLENAGDNQNGRAAEHKNPVRQAASNQICEHEGSAHLIK